MSSEKTAYVDAQIEAIASEEELDINQATQEYLKRSEHVVKMEDLRPQNHNWIDRGVVMSCEGAGHPNHRAFKRR